MPLGIPGPRALRTQLADTVRAIADTNRAGQAYGFLAITPIKPGHAEALRALLATIDAGPSPFSRLPRTHFARWVVLTDFFTGDAYQPADEDHLGCEYLIFSACFDGDRDSYLEDLTAEIADELDEIYDHCIGVRSNDPTDVARYLVHNQIDCGLFYSAYPHTTVAEVRRVVAQRTALRALAVAQYDLTPEELQAQFVDQLGAA
ncbi:MAG: hypothetical protein AAGC46_01280 [Solirubrobacteraceae bacterium]|nr:hypothetical protein [Patulibacter sp.]